MHSPAWKSSFGFWPDADAMREVTTLKAMGVHEVGIRIGCTSPGEFFTDLAEAVAEKDVAVDVTWLKQVRDLCESMAPRFIEQLWLAAASDDDGPDSNYQDELAMGNYLLHVRVHCGGEETSASADFHFPAAEAESESLFIRRETRKLPVPPATGNVTRVVAGKASVAAEVN
jgi:hypothetical protein